MMYKVLKHSMTILIDLCVFALRGGVAAARRKGVRVGKDCRIYIRSFGTEPFLVTIGDRVTITSGVRILTHDGSTSLVRNPSGRRYQRYAPVHIGNDVFIGINTIILPGVKIGSNVIVGAGSVVTKNIPDGAVVAGNPARQITSFDSFCKRVEQSCANDSELDSLADYKTRVRKALEISASRQ